MLGLLVLSLLLLTNVTAQTSPRTLPPTVAPTLQTKRSPSLSSK
jgi:hypothetical protein